MESGQLAPCQWDSLEESFSKKVAIKGRQRVDSGYSSAQLSPVKSPPDFKWPKSPEFSPEDDYWFHRTAKDLVKLQLSLGANLVDLMNETDKNLVVADEAKVQLDMEELVVRSKQPRRKVKELPDYCVFCKNNNEDNKRLWSSHTCKDETGRVTCPVLRSFHCPYCYATGDWAHTVRYCPVKKEKELKQLEDYYNRTH